MIIFFKLKLNKIEASPSHTSHTIGPPEGTIFIGKIINFS